MGKRFGSTAARAAIVAAASAAFAPATFAQTIPSFSGADGAGSVATGGRGGDVYHVTLVDQSYSDARPGTLRYGLTTGIPAAGRTIVFDVAGVFRMDKASGSGYTFDGNGWDTQSRLNLPSNVTIAGQTAPGSVVLMGGVVKMSAQNTILRNVTVAAGYGRRGFRATDGAPTGTMPDTYAYDAIDISGQRLMIDHVTTVYGTDETISANELADDLTIQYSNVSQGQNYPQNDAEGGGYTGHALGSLFQMGTNANLSVHHNLYAHQKGRLPRVGSEVGTGAFNDFRNNVFYNWLGTAGGGSGTQPSFNNMVGNFYLAGDGGENPAGGVGNTTVTTAAGGTGIFGGASGTRLYQSGNVADTNKDADALDGVTLANSAFGSSAFQGSAYAQTPYFGVTDSATDAYGRVLDYVGATWWDRSIIDARLVAETRNGTGTIKAWGDNPFSAADDAASEWRAVAAMPTVTRANTATFDTDQDGMPDAWELKHGLDPSVASNNGDFDADGYTNLEEYINELAEWPASRAIVFNGVTNSRYAQITNWDIQWQPSKYDAARIVSGTAIVDAVGQHARTLTVGDTSGQTAALSVTGGWIDVVETLQLGRTSLAATAGTGSVMQSGGAVLAGTSVTIGVGGSYTLSGGSLSTPLLTKPAIAGAPAGTFSFTGGTLNVGRVTFDLAVTGTGILAPGLGVGQTTLDGDLTMIDGALAIELASATAFDRLLVGDVATLDGTLLVAAGYAPTPGQSWTILTAAGGIVGGFDAITPGYAVRVVGNDLVLSFTGAVPEPATLVALAGVGAIVGRRRRVL